MVHVDFNKKYAPKGGESFGNVLSREIKYFYHITQILGIRASYIMSVVPRLTARLFRTNIRFIKNGKINEHGFSSLHTTFEFIINSIYQLNLEEASKTISEINQNEISKTKYFIHLLSLEKKQLLAEIKENEQNCTMMEYNSILSKKNILI